MQKNTQMIKKQLMSRALVVVALVFVINLVASRFYWYFTIYGFDKVMHTLGGVFLALLGASLFYNRLSEKTIRIIVQLILFAFVFGFIWEVYEYVVQFFIKGVQLANVIDSIGDVAFDMLGGLIGSYFVISLKKRYTVHNE